jgi:soluble lytic murein transglycosylase-like protein
MDTLLTIATLFAVAVAALALVIGAIRCVDRWVFPELSFSRALNDNNLAVGIFLAALAFGIFFLVGRAVAAPGDVGRYDEDFRRWGRWHFGYSVDWRVFKAQGMTESALDPAACSHAGACGLMQLMPGTARAMGVVDRFEARESIRAGIAYDKRLWGIFIDPRPPDDRLAFAFAAYNWGPGNVLRKGQPCALDRFGADRLWRHLEPCLPEETRAYVPRISRWHGRFSKGPAWTP